VRTGDRTSFESGDFVPDRLHYRCEALELHPAFPHRYQCLVGGRCAEQRRVGVRLFEVTQNRRHLGDDRAVFEDERRDNPARIDLGVGLGELLLRPEIDGDARDANPLLCEKDANAARIGRATRLV